MSERSIRAADAGQVRTLMAIFVGLIGIYMITGTLGPPISQDQMTNSLSAWYIGVEGSPHMSHHGAALALPDVRHLAWLIDTPGGPVGQYPPGTALIAAPFYAVHRGDLTLMPVGEISPSGSIDQPSDLFPVPPLLPGAIAASFLTAATVVMLLLAIWPGLADRLVWPTAIAMGLGTGAWSVASDSLWTHGPGMMCLASGAYFASRERYVMTGLAYGLSILVRPHLAVIPLAVGLSVALAGRSWRALASVGFGSVLGLGALIAYNRLVFGQWTISGGYGTYFSDQFFGQSLGWYLRNVTLSLVDPTRGLLVWAPFLILLIPGLPSAWRASQPWAKGAAIGGVIYLLLQLRANRYSGGSGFFGYRYPLEMLVAAGPLLVAAYQTWTSQQRWSTVAFRFSVAAAITGQAIGANALWFAKTFGIV